MTSIRFTFAGGPGDFAIVAPSTTSGVVNAYANAHGTAWSQAAGGTQYTDLLAIGSGPAPVETDPNGFIYPFQGPAGITIVWVDFGGGQRFPLVARELVNILGGDGGIPAGQLTTGTVAEARLPVDVQRATLDAVYATKVAKNLVSDFGGVGDRSTDNTAAFNAAVAWANSLNPSGTGDARVIGGTIIIPDGGYVITGTVNPILRSGVNFVGESENGTVLLLSYAGVTFTWGGPSDMPIGGGMSNLKIEYWPGVPDPAALVFNIYQASRLRFENLMLANVCQLLSLGTSTSYQASAITLLGIRGYVYNSGVEMINARFGAGLIIADSSFFVQAVPFPTINRTSTMITLAGTNGVNFGEGSWDTCQITGSFFEKFYRGIQVVPVAAAVINDFHVANTYFDYIRNSAIWLNTTSGGIIAAFTFSNCWFACWEDAAFSMTGTGTLRGITVNDNHFISAGTHGILTDTGCRDIFIEGNMVNGTNRTNVNAIGIAVFGGSHVLVEGNISGYDTTWGGFPWQPYAGIGIAADLDYITVRGNDASGTAMNYFLGVNTAGSVNRNVSGNLGATYAGTAPITMPASNALWVNTAPTACEVFIYGGTVSAIFKNTVAIAGMTSGHMILNPGESVAATYTVAPSISRFILA